jgi:hypothetical protein
MMRRAEALLRHFSSVDEFREFVSNFKLASGHWIIHDPSWSVELTKTMWAFSNDMGLLKPIIDFILKDNQKSNDYHSI